MGNNIDLMLNILNDEIQKKEKYILKLESIEQKLEKSIKRNEVLLNDN